MDRKNPSVDFFISAAEPSADAHGAELLRELQKQKELQITGIFGPLMRNVSKTHSFEMERLMSMGFIDIIAAIPRLVRMFFRIRKNILETNPKVCIFIDYPGFHLRLQRSLKKKGYQGKMIHYVCPSVWAWSRGRIVWMEQNLNHLLTIFPFEKECFKNTKLPVTYVGNPLVQKVQNYSYERKFPENTLALFPGSRTKEIQRNLPIQLEALRKVQGSYFFAVSISQERHFALIQKLVQKSGVNVELVAPKYSYDLMKSSHLAIATSGTVTLELALHSVPTVVTFKIGTFDLLIAQKVFKIDLPFYCIVNIIENKEIFPELFGPILTPNKLYYHVNHLLTSKNERLRCIEKLQSLQKNLEEKNPAKKAASVAFSEWKLVF